MNAPSVQDPIGGLLKRSFSISRRMVTPRGNALPDPEPLACFLARDETLARMYADILWPGGILDVQDSEATPHLLRNRCRARFLLDVDLARETSDFVVASTPGCGVCMICACTDETACLGGCYWVTPVLCSACCVRAGIDPLKRQAVELAKRDSTPDVFPPELTFAPAPQAADLIRQACFALYGGQPRQCFELLLRAAAELSPHAPSTNGLQTSIVNHAPDETIQIIKKETKPCPPKP